MLTNLASHLPSTTCIYLLKWDLNDLGYEQEISCSIKMILNNVLAGLTLFHEEVQLALLEGLLEDIQNPDILL